MERAERTRQKAQRQLVEARVTKIRDILRKHPEHVNDIYEFASRLVESRAPALPAIAPSFVGGGGALPAAPPADANDQKQSSMHRAIDRRSKELQHLPVCDLKILLFSMDKKSFGTCAIKALQRPGQRDVSKSIMCEVIEHLTGMPPFFVISGFFGTLGELVKHALQMMSEFPGRATRLHMPPEWSSSKDADTDGVYLVMSAAVEEVWVRHRESGHEFKIPNGTNGVEWTEADGVYVEFNWSDDRAVLKSKISAKEVRLSSMLARPPLMLADGAAGEPVGGGAADVPSPARAQLPSESRRALSTGQPSQTSTGSTPPKGLMRGFAAARRRLGRQPSRETIPSAKKARTSGQDSLMSRSVSVSSTTASLHGSSSADFTTPRKTTSCIESDAGTPGASSTVAAQLALDFEDAAAASITAKDEPAELDEDAALAATLNEQGSGVGDGGSGSEMQPDDLFGGDLDQRALACAAEARPDANRGGTE